MYFYTRGFITLQLFEVGLSLTFPTAIVDSLFHKRYAMVVKSTSTVKL